MPAFFVGALHIVLSSVLADVPPCYAEFTETEWGPWSACSVTCNRGIRHRKKQCKHSGDVPPDDRQETETESCDAGNVCHQDVTARILLAQGHANATLRDHVFRTVTVYDVTECGLLCSRDLRCKSFNMCNETDKILCELNSATSEDSGKDFRWTISCSYYSTVFRDVTY